MSKALVIHLPNIPGACRWCGCTYDRPCAGGCAWANTAETLCTACVNFDRLIKSARGRAELLEKIQEAELL